MRADLLRTPPTPFRTDRRTGIRRGFTIVEILVVVAVIAILMGLLLGALRGAIGTSRKIKELNFLRGLHAAWQQYANNSDEAILPGYLEAQTQADWRVTYRNASGQTVPAALAQTYPWRLAGYFGKEAFTAMLGYGDSFELADGEAEESMDWPIDMTTVPSWMQPSLGTAGSALAFQPVGGYNAMYLGGWYKGSQPQYIDATWTDQRGAQRKGGLVATRLSQIRRPSEVAMFVTSTFRAPGRYDDRSSGEDAAPGCAWVVPSRLGTMDVWGSAMGIAKAVGKQSGPAGGTGSTPPPPPPMGAANSGVLQVNVAQGVPVRRHNRMSGVVYPDGNVDSKSMSELMDMRMWIDAADSPDFQHSDS